MYAGRCDLRGSTRPNAGGCVTVAPRMSTFGSLLRHFRLEAKLSQEALAERARVSVETIGALERGARRSPYRDTLALLVEALGLGGEDPVRWKPPRTG